MSLATHVVDTGVHLQPNPGRAITRFFVPGHEDSGPGDSRAASVIDRLLALSEADVIEAMSDIDSRFGSRHLGLHETFLEHAELICSSLAVDTQMSPARCLLLGASFTNEYSVEAAALCNPSVVLHPDYDSIDNGDVTFILSVRNIGEGHRSSIGFRTGTLSSAGVVAINEPGRFPRTVSATVGRHRRTVFRTRLAELSDDHENAALVLDSLPAEFDDDELERRITTLAADRMPRRHTADTIGHLRALAQSSYQLDFPSHTEISERVLWPQVAVERQGMEDARFVRFTDHDDTTTYYATYTAYDGANISQQLLQTRDFTSFTSNPIAGAAAVGKGLALFPRRINGQYVALCRSDGESNSIAFSDDIRCWPTSQPIQVPKLPWEVLQLGNSGSPIETEHGWLVLTHGVGPMRTYSLGAILLDLDEPGTVIGRSRVPVLTPNNTTRDGYVPNVVYSCGALAHHDTLLLPYAIADSSIRIATLSINELIGAMTTDELIDT